MPSPNVFDPVEVLDHGFVRLVSYMGSDAAICEAARVSYLSNKTASASNDEALIRYLMRHNHTSPFEMCELVFHVKLPIFVARQWMRHRTWSYNEISGRYSELPAETYIPKAEDVAAQAKNNKQGRGGKLPEAIVENFQRDCLFIKDQAFSCYEEGLNANVAKELARINLPLATYTEFYCKVDLHNLFHFLKLRLDPHAQYEIRVYAEAIMDIVQELFPLASFAFYDYRLKGTSLSFNEYMVVSAVLKNANWDLIRNLLMDSGSSEREITEFISKFRV